MAMGLVKRISLCVIFLVVPLYAQTNTDMAHPVAAASSFEVGAGYAFMSTTASPSVSQLNLFGANANATLQISQRWGGTADFLYSRATNVAGTGRNGYTVSGLAGPVFYLIQGRGTSVFVHALAGIARVNGAVITSPNSYYTGYENRFSYAFGGGVERTIIGPFAARICGDYQRTTFVGPTLALEGQNNLRVTAGITYRFGSR